MHLQSIMKIKSIFLITFLAVSNFGWAQSNFSESPLNAVFEISDTKRFWNAFDKMSNSTENPFREYIENGSPGVKDL